MRITGLRKKGRRVEVSFDNSSALVLNYEIFLKNGLKMNMELSESRFLLLQEENLKYEIKQSALNLLARRLHSTRELRTKLLQKHRNPEIIEDVLNYLMENNYLNDKQFASEFISEKSKSKLWGSRKINAELRKKGIDNRVADDEFIGEHLTGNNEHLKTAAEKKLKNLSGRNIPPEKIKQKLISYLLSKGYDYDDIKTVTNEMLTDINDEE